MCSGVYVCRNCSRTITCIYICQISPLCVCIDVILKQEEEGIDRLISLLPFSVTAVHADADDDEDNADDDTADDSGFLQPGIVHCNKNVSTSDKNDDTYLLVMYAHTCTHVHTPARS